MIRSTPPYTEDEATIVREHYPTLGAVKCAALLSRRTHHSIRQWAFRHGIKGPVSRELNQLLSRNENVFVCMLADGDSVAEAAAALGLSPSRGREMIKTLRSRFEARNIVQLIYIVASRGLIPLDTTANNETHSAP